MEGLAGNRLVFDFDPHDRIHTPLAPPCLPPPAPTLSRPRSGGVRSACGSVVRCHGSTSTCTTGSTPFGIYDGAAMSGQGRRSASSSPGSGGFGSSSGEGAFGRPGPGGPSAVGRRLASPDADGSASAPLLPTVPSTHSATTTLDLPCVSDSDASLREGRRSSRSLSTRWRRDPGGMGRGTPMRRPATSTTGRVTVLDAGGSRGRSARRRRVDPSDRARGATSLCSRRQRLGDGVARKVHAGRTRPVVTDHHSSPAPPRDLLRGREARCDLSFRRDGHPQSSSKASL